MMTTLLGHIISLRKIWHAARKSAAHRKYERALVNAGLPLKAARTNMNCRAVGEARKARKDLTTRALKAKVSAS